MFQSRAVELGDRRFATYKPLETISLFQASFGQVGCRLSFLKITSDYRFRESVV